MTAVGDDRKRERVLTSELSGLLFNFQDMMRKLKGGMKTVTPGQYCEIFLLKKIKNVGGNIALVLFYFFIRDLSFNPEKPEGKKHSPIRQNPKGIR